MNWQIYEKQEFIENLGWSLIHSLWQISLIAVVLFCSLRILKNASANLRYLFSISALFLALIMPLTTFVSLSPNGRLETENFAAQLNKNTLSSSSSKINESSENSENDINSVEKVQNGKEKSSTMLANMQVKAQKIFTGFLPYLVWIWLIGVLLFSLRFCGGIWQTHKLKTQQNSAVNNYWENRFDVLCQTVGIYKPIKFLQSEIITTPMVIGWLKPFVIVPSSILLGSNPHELETIIVHELIHIRRQDYLVNILQSFVEILMFFHPLIWWISAQVRSERENACDDEVLKIFNSEPLLYANALANLEEFRAQSNNLMPSNILAANGGNLMCRIQRIIKNVTGMNNSKGSIWSASLAFLLTFVISVSLFSAIWYRNGKETTNIDAKRIAIAIYSASQFLIIEDIDDADKTMSLLTNNLKKHNIPVVGYSNGGQVRTENRQEREERITNMWRDSGFEIGSNFLKFPKSFDKTLADYQRVNTNRSMSATLQHDVQMKELRNKYPKPAEMSPEDKENLNNELRKLIASWLTSQQDEQRKWLKENNLKSVTFTINSVDWMYSNIYDSARNSNDKKLMTYVQDQYLEYLSKIFDYYEDASQQKFDRKIPQTFGLEPSRLTADSIDRILEMLQKRGYEFISMDEALKDEAFSKTYTFGTRSSFFDSADIFGKPDSKRLPIEKPKPNENIMKVWYVDVSAN